MSSSLAPPGPRIPLTVDATEALGGNGDLVTEARFEKRGDRPALVIRLDVRKRNWRKVFGLPRGSRIRWEHVRDVEVQELSCLMGPIVYRITIGDGCYVDATGQRRYFGVDAMLPGLDLKRGVSMAVIRAAVLLAVVGGVGLRQVCWLLSMLFHIDVSSSSLDRWIAEAGDHLPDAEGMAKRLLADKPVTEAHFDEIFPQGRKGPVLVVRDEHGRILCAEEVEARDTVTVVGFLEKLKGWGFAFRTFYIDHCAAYAEAIPKVFPDARIQYDYFHILQNVWRTLWKTFVSYRKDIKRRARDAEDPVQRGILEALAKRLWEKRGLIFTAEDNLTAEDRTELCALVEHVPRLDAIRVFLNRVRGIFTDSNGELGARQRLGRLQALAEQQEPPAFAKVTKFLDGHFDNMITFLRVPDVKRNSLAETGMRSLRRLERGHDGFRTREARDRYLRLFQAIRHFGWSVYRHDSSLALPAPA